MQLRPRTLLVVGLVLLAGCGGTGMTGVTPENPQTTFEPSTTATETPADSSSRLQLRNEHDGPVQVRIELASAENETTFYAATTTLPAGAVRDYRSQVANRSEFRATVSVAEDTVSFLAGPDGRYSVVVTNNSAVDVYESESG